jgi:hypothetical protein
MAFSSDERQLQYRFKEGRFILWPINPHRKSAAHPACALRSDGKTKSIVVARRTQKGFMDS